MSYTRGFSPEWEVPSLFPFLVSQGALQDLSSPNDVAPSFGQVFTDASVVRIWVDHPLASHREYPGSKRFRVDVGPLDSESEATFEHDELEDAVGVLFRELGKAWRARPHDDPWESPDDYLEDLVARWIANFR